MSPPILAADSTLPSPIATNQGALPAERSNTNVVRSALAGSSYGALRRLRCEWIDGRFCLSGEVPTYFLKQLAYAAVKRFAGATYIVDRVTVADDKPQTN